MKRIEDYGLIGDSRSAALVSRDGSVEWLCFPRFDSAAVFAALLGDENHGHWTLAAADSTARVSRRYRTGTAVLETRFETRTGAATVIDFMAPVAGEPGSQLIRLVRGDEGEVDMRTTLRFRFDYGRLTPWLRRVEGGVIAVAGPDAVRLTSPVPLVNRDWTTCADFTVGAGERTPFALTWFPSHLKPPPERDPRRLLDLVDRAWRRWIGRSSYRGPWREAVERSLITLKLLTYQPTGGIVAAPTTSLPEEIGGARNWDYRYCWIRDATLTLYALLSSGYRREAESWRRWLLRAAAGSPQDLQIMYGLHGEPRLPESILDWLPGFADSRPVRVGNAAQQQLQLDVFGELTGVLHAARRFGMGADHDSWRLQQVILRHLEDVWREPDAGLWEVRGPQRHFVHSKVMAWYAFDRMVASARAFGLEGPVDHWCEVREAIRAEVCERGFDRRRGTFVQYYGATNVDAALLYIPIVGFLPPDDPRVLGTLAAVERELLEDGLVRRYSVHGDLDGLPGEEGAFLACSFWLCDVYRMCGREDDARALFERLLALSNDLGLLAEEYDPRAGRQLGNFPQAFSHVALINTAHGLTAPGRALAEHARADTAGGRA
ncbi:glycoside hydrolase family 15 protein [Caulobacter sp. 17J65-9]|uniref:glycoside hydrolase family 15 protein n=1 Tax=Caulobacter sp. 17J65-9 TaxID=2709382 RepID=UPI0013CA39C2|nr:glycoside hydrolase family 15 protein [Caulobacter sp. 17J65-9]NEX93649.1 glycoside hydrolase family 15 protein [Caulobacter sp. 17J65-9]